MKIIRSSSDPDRPVEYEVSTPWLRSDDAARYLGVSRRFFDRAVAAANISYGWSGRSRVYHTSELDKLCMGGCDVPEASDGDHTG